VPTSSSKTSPNLVRGRVRMRVKLRIRLRVRVS